MPHENTPVPPPSHALSAPRRHEPAQHGAGIRAAATALVLILAAASGLSGCSSKSSTPTGTGDISGLRLGAFASDRSGQYDIYLWDYDAQAFKEIPAIRSTAAERHPTISSDGRFIAFQVNRGGSRGDDIEMFDRKGPAFVDLSPIQTSADENEPAFSGNAKLLCYTQVTGGLRRIRLFDGVAGAAIALPGIDTSGVYNDYSPSPNYDASLIAFVSTRNGGPDIFIYDRNRRRVLNGTRLDPFLVSANEDIDPSFSQSGRFLTFASNRPGGMGGYDVFVVEFAVTSGTQTDTLLHVLPLANSGSDERHPTISDTGNTLVFQSNRAGNYDLWNYNRNSSTLTHPDPPSTYNSAGDDIEPSLKWPY